MQVLKGHWQLITLTALVFALWTTPIVFPLKILVVFMHELSHGLAAVLTGGSIIDISISAQQGGHAVTLGGNSFAILTAGYLGSLLIGVLLLITALRSDADRLVMGACGVVVLLVAGFYIRDGFALLFCLVTSVAMLAMAQFLSRDINDLALRVIGLTSLIYAPYDIFSDTIARSQLRSDAFMLAERFGGSAAMWGGIWLVLSFAVIALSLRYGIGKNSNIFWQGDEA